MQVHTEESDGRGIPAKSGGFFHTHQLYTEHAGHIVGSLSANPLPEIESHPSIITSQDKFLEHIGCKTLPQTAVLPVRELHLVRPRLLGAGFSILLSMIRKAAGCRRG